MSFQHPTAETIQKALGDVTELPDDMKKAVTHRLDESFRPVPQPSGGDWLGCHDEKGQTVKSFEKNTFKAVPHGTYRTIYIQPFGPFDSTRSAPLPIIQKFARAFFAGCEVEILPGMGFAKEMTHRINDWTHKIQYETGGFYDQLSKTRDKRDRRREILTVAVTMADLYPNDQWNFVYGQANPVDGLGVYSFARLDPLFEESAETLKNTPLSDQHRILILRRCVKILLHELGHLFGLSHCIYYLCLMNGANHEREMDQQTLYVCPVCLRKLYSTLNFNVRSVYQSFLELCEEYHLNEEAVWYRKRLECLDN